MSGDLLYRPLGHSGIQASILGLGTWGSSGGSFLGKADEKEAIKTIHAAIDQGINLIDTAPYYGFGEGEILVGKAIKDRRDQVVVITKCGLWWTSEKRDFAFEINEKKIYRCLSKETIYQEIDDSLRRLQTDYIDLYMTHWPERGEEATPISETMEALLNLKAIGKIRAIGVCNVEPPLLSDYLKEGIIDAIQNQYSLVYQTAIDQPLKNLLKQYNVASIGWRPLEQGLLAGFNFIPPGSHQSYRSSSYWFKPENRTRVSRLLNTWKPLCDQYHCTIAELVLAWTIAQEAVSHLLVGARTDKNLSSIKRVSQLKIEGCDLDKMTKDIGKMIAY